MGAAWGVEGGLAALFGPGVGARGAARAPGGAAVLVFYGWRIMQRNLDVDTTTLFFSMGVVYAIVPLAAFAVGLYALADARAAFRAFASPPKARP